MSTPILSQRISNLEKDLEAALVLVETLKANWAADVNRLAITKTALLQISHAPGIGIIAREALDAIKL